jgi:transposase
MSEVYCKTLKKLCGAIQNKRHGMLTSSVMMLHDSACSHTTAGIQALLERYNWKSLDRTPYSPDLAPSNSQLFTYLKKWFGSQHFSNNEELMEDGKTWLSSQAADFFDTGIQKLIPHYNKCLNFSSDYIEK